MGGELDRINPTIVEGAEDIFGAELQTHRPGSYGKRSEGHSRMTHEQVAELRKHLARRKNMKRAEQGYDDKMDESLGMRHRGRHSQSMKSRRDEASAMDKMHSKMGRKYDDVMTMDAQGYDDKMDESLGMRHRGRHSQSMKSRRDEASAMDKRHSKMGRKYDDVMTMDSDCDTHDEYNAYDDPISERQVYLIKELGGRVGRNMNRSKASDYIKELQGKESGTWKDAESFEANDMPVSEENMVNEGSVDAVYGGGVNVAVSGDGITPTANPSVDEAFNVGNDVGIDVSEQEVMNVNPSVDAQYGDGSMSAEGNDIVETVQDLTGKVGFRINGWVASAIVVGIASMAGLSLRKEVNNMSRRERIGSRYITRRKDGTFSKNVDIGRSLSADRRKKAKRQVKVGQGDKGDIKRADYEAQIGVVERPSSDIGYVEVKDNKGKTTAVVDVLADGRGDKAFDISVNSPTDEEGMHDESLGTESTYIRFDERGMVNRNDVRMAEDKHPKLSAKAKSVYVFPKRQAYPIGDLKHGKYALIYSTWPENKKDAAKVRAAVFKRYPSLRKWFEGGKYERKDVPDEYNAESFEAEASCSNCGSALVMNAEGEHSCGCGTEMGAESSNVAPTTGLSFNYSLLHKVVTELHDEEKINIGVSNPSYGGYVGYTSGPYGCGNNCSQVLLNIGYYSYGAKTKTPSAWIETVKAQIGDDKKLMDDFDYGLSDGEYAIEENSYSSFEYTDGLYSPSGEKATVQFDSGRVHCSAYHAGFVIGNAIHDIPIIEAALRKAQGDERNAESFEARTYRRTPARRKGERKSKREGKMRRFRKLQSARKSMAAQGYDDKLDESMGMRDGKETTKEQTMKDRRDESKGTEKAMGDRAYSGVKSMDIGERRIPKGFAPNMHYITQQELQEEARKNRNMKDAEEFGAEDYEGHTPADQWTTYKMGVHSDGRLSDNAYHAVRIGEEGFDLPITKGADARLVANAPKLLAENLRLKQKARGLEIAYDSVIDVVNEFIETDYVSNDGAEYLRYNLDLDTQFNAEEFGAEVDVENVKRLGRSFYEGELEGFGLPEETYDSTYELIREGIGNKEAKEWSRAVKAVEGRWYLDEPYDFGAENIVEDVKDFDVVGTAQDVVGKTGVNIPTGVASLAVLWVAYMTGKKYGN